MWPHTVVSAADMPLPIRVVTSGGKLGLGQQIVVKTYYRRALTNEIYVKLGSSIRLGMRTPSPRACYTVTATCYIFEKDSLLSGVSLNGVCHMYDAKCVLNQPPLKFSIILLVK